MKIGLYFGSFNPVHIGHLIIANHVLNFADIRKVWFIVSPQNPLKPSAGLLNEYHRLHLLRLAIEDNNALAVSDVEFKLPRPSYTIDTLTYLKEKYPEHEFSIIMGSDSYQNIKKWKNYELLMQENKIIIYQRPGFEVVSQHQKTEILSNTPLLDISATAIRNLIKQSKSIRYLVPDKTCEEILVAGYYRK